MVKRSYGFSVQGLGALVSAPLLAIFLAASIANAEPAATAPSGVLDSTFLLLPAFDVERSSTEVVHAGDHVPLRILGLSQNGVPKLVPPPGTESFSEQGWQITAPTGTSSPQGELRFEAVPLKSGKLSLPSLLIQGEDGKDLGRTHPFTMDVESVIDPKDPNAGKPADMRPPVGVSFPVSLIVLAVVILSLIHI